VRGELDCLDVRYEETSAEATCAEAEGDRVSVQEVHDYWRSPSWPNAPETYIEDREPRSKYLAALIAAAVPATARVLELGCNVGANLDCLQRHGFTNLNGVEINGDAVKLMRKTFPNLAAARIHRKPIEEFVTRMGRYDLVFTLAVFEHLHPESEWVFAKIAKRTRFLVTIEDEWSASARHFPRDYGTLFEGLGMRQTFAETGLDERAGLETQFVARVFEAER
jgi:2-polyprenyl-3-methyl-5-hydroxy-6-metoxy-1,4-benzoquinol methylase